MNGQLPGRPFILVDYPDADFSAIVIDSTLYLENCVNARRIYVYEWLTVNSLFLTNPGVG